MSDEARARIAAFMDAVALFAGGSYRRATQHKNGSGISRRAMFAEAVTCGRLCRRDSPNPRPARQDPHRGPAANRPVAGTSAVPFIESQGGGMAVRILAWFAGNNDVLDRR